MNECGRFIAWTPDGIEEVRDFAHLAGGFVSVETFADWPDVRSVTVWEPSYTVLDLVKEGASVDARSLSYLGVLPDMEGASYW